MRAAETPEEAAQRYQSAMHAVQTGVRCLIEACGETLATPKHLRVGVDSAHISDAALVRLLIAKGLLTQEEYTVELADEAEREVARLEARCTAQLGRPIKLA